MAGSVEARGEVLRCEVGACPGDYNDQYIWKVLVLRVGPWLGHLPKLLQKSRESVGTRPELLGDIEPL